MADGDGGNTVNESYPVDLQRRLTLLRREHPTVALDVELIRADDNIAVVKASLTLPGAGSVSSLGVVAGEEISRAIELAERRAIERALAIALSSIAVETPVAAPTPITNRQPPPQRAPAERRPPQPAPAERRPPAPIRTNAPIDIGANRPAPAPARPQPAPVEGEPALADYSWTAFWSWARENGLSKQGDIEQIIGQSYENMTPAEVRKLILAKRGG